MDLAPIDLTQSTSNSEDEAPTAKRGRWAQEEDDDVVLVERKPGTNPPRPDDGAPIGDDEELTITGATGAVSLGQ